MSRRLSEGGGSDDNSSRRSSKRRRTTTTSSHTTTSRSSNRTTARRRSLSPDNDHNDDDDQGRTRYPSVDPHDDYYEQHSSFNNNNNNSHTSPRYTSPNNSSRGRYSPNIMNSSPYNYYGRSPSPQPNDDHNDNDEPSSYVVVRGIRGTRTSAAATAFESDDDNDHNNNDESGRGGAPLSRHRPSTGIIRTDTTTSSLDVTITDPDVLHCDICLDFPTSPVFQCENGHIACASCCTKMSNKCASCSLSIGTNRCRAIEKILESIIITCRYKHYGCKESLTHSKKLDHEKTCVYTPCTCPHFGCNRVVACRSLYRHFSLRHSTSRFIKFRFNEKVSITLDRNQKHVFLQESKDSLVFVLNNHRMELSGSRVSVLCIALGSSKEGLSYDVTVKDGESLLKLTTAIEESNGEWPIDVASKKFLPVPNDFFSSNGQLKLELVILH